MQAQQPKQPVELLSFEQLTKFYLDLQKKCQMLEDFEDPRVSNQTLIEQFGIAQKYITQNQLFSENEKIKDIQTENLRFLTLPYHIGFLYGRVSNPRKEAIQQSKNYLQAYLGLLQTFNSEAEQIFPQNAMRTWTTIKDKKQYNLERDQVIANHKQRKLIEQRYKNTKKHQDEGDQRQNIKDYLSMKIFDAITQLKGINQQAQILQYKATLQKDPQLKKAHEAEQQKPIPKMKVWQVKKKQQIHQCMCPPHSLGEHKMNKVAQVWQQNANKPTMTLQQVAQLEIDNMHARTEREKKQKQANKVDTDSDKEEVDDRQKKEARAWDDWKDAHQKGAGNKGNR